MLNFKIVLSDINQEICSKGEGREWSMLIYKISYKLNFITRDKKFFVYMTCKNKEYCAMKMHIYR